MNMQQAIKTITEGRNLAADDMQAVMRLIMTGEATPAQIGGFLIGLRMKGETVEEIAAAAQVMRELAEKVDVKGKHIVDIVGTGGDQTHSFNISTASSFVAAAAGAQVAKHGNRSVSSTSGAADVLEAAGARLDLSPEQVGQCIAKCGIGFMFAPNHHKAMKHAIGPRRDMGVRTIFNILGPLTNPASVPNQLLGVFTRDLVEPLAKVLNVLGSHHVMVVHAGGMDEISIAAETFVAELKEGVVKTYTITPEDFSLRRGNLDDIKVNSAQESLAILKSVLANQLGAARDIVALNAGAAIYVSGRAENLKQGVQRALQVLADGSARTQFENFVSTTKMLIGHV